MQLQWKGKVPSRYKYDPIMWVMSQNQMLWRHISTAFYIVSNNHLLQSSLRVLVRVGASVHKPCLSVCVGIWCATQMSRHRVAGLQQERDCWRRHVPLRQLIREWPGYSIINRTLTTERGATGAHFHPHNALWKHFECISYRMDVQNTFVWGVP